MKLLPLIFILAILIVPDLAWAQGNITPDGLYTGGGLIPCGQSAANPCNSCHVVILANTIIKWVIGITFMIFAGVAVYAGVKMVISGNSHALQDAKEMFTNAFIGLLIVLGAWLMIDTLLRFVLKGGENGNIDGYGPWSQVECTSMAESTITQMTITEEEFVPGQMMQSSHGAAYSGGPLAQCATSNAACSVNALKAAGFSDREANIMSCIAMTESSGNPSTPPYNIANPGSNSTACGLFQVTGTTWRATATGNCANFSNCTNVTCNVQTARKLVNTVQFTPWTCSGCNNKAQHCITQFGG